MVARSRALALLLVFLPWLAGVSSVLASPFYSAPRLVVLTYHDIGYPEEGHRISRERLLSHLDALEKAGYGFLPLEAVGAFLEGQYTPPKNSVVLTFDDGYVSFYREVYPILKQRKIPAAVFIITGDVGTGRRLSWAQMREMESDGSVHIRFYVHTHAGHDLIDTDGDGIPDSRFYAAPRWLSAEGRRETQEEYYQRVRLDLRAARLSIEANLGHASPYAAVPGNGWSPIASRAAQEESYRYVFVGGRNRLVRKVGDQSPLPPLPRLDAGRPGITPQKLLELLAGTRGIYVLP